MPLCRLSWSATAGSAIARRAALLAALAISTVLPLHAAMNSVDAAGKPPNPPPGVCGCRSAPKGPAISAMSMSRISGRTACISI